MDIDKERKFDLKEDPSDNNFQYLLKRLEGYSGGETLSAWIFLFVIIFLDLDEKYIWILLALSALSAIFNRYKFRSILKGLSREYEMEKNRIKAENK